MKYLPLATLLLLASCASQDRYNAVATACQTYSAALRTAAALNNAGKLSPNQVEKITATVKPAEQVCTGPAPVNDKIALQNVTNAILTVLEAQGGN